MPNPDWNTNTHLLTFSLVLGHVNPTCALGNWQKKHVCWTKIRMLSRTCSENHPTAGTKKIVFVVHAWLKPFGTKLHKHSICKERFLQLHIERWILHIGFPSGRMSYFALTSPATQEGEPKVSDLFLYKLRKIFMTTGPQFCISCDGQKWSSRPATYRIPLQDASPINFSVVRNCIATFRYSEKYQKIQKI